MGDRQRPARVEYDAVFRALEPIDGEVSDVNHVVWPGVDGDGMARAVVDAGALEASDADRLGRRWRHTGAERAHRARTRTTDIAGRTASASRIAV